MFFFLTNSWLREHFQLGRRRNHARPGQRKFSYPRRELSSRPSEYYMKIGRSNHWTGGSRVRFSPGVRKVLLSRASMVSPPFKLKMFTGSVCVLLTSVSLKLITIKIELIYATTSSWEKKTKWRVKGKWCRLILFFFLSSELIFLWSELIQPWLVVRVDPVRLLYLPHKKCVIFFPSCALLWWFYGNFAKPWLL